MSPPCAVQALAALRVIADATEGSVGAKKLASVRNNSNLFRKRMIEEGFQVLGDIDSTICPIMVNQGRKLSYVTRECTKRGIAVVIVGYPAVPILWERVRVCISAAHTPEQLRQVVADLTEVFSKLGLLYEKTSDEKVKKAEEARRQEYADWLRNAPLEKAATAKIAPEAQKWTPEPLAPMLHTQSRLLDLALTAATTAAPRAKLDFRMFDPLGYMDRPSPKSKEAMEATLDVYGFGACGPRGFYGTTLPHLDLEKNIAEFLQTGDAIAYSAGIATISSVLPAHIKPIDHVVTFTDVHLGIRTGLRLCKCKVTLCQPGDVAAMDADLSRAVKVKHAKKADQVARRMFIVAEAIGQRTGRLCPLRELVALKEKYAAYSTYLILDESLSFGTLGENGRGLHEALGVDISRIDAVVGSLEHAVAGVGGFCAGRHGVIEHQRLSGAGYCYSAAKPPAACAGAAATIGELLGADGAARRKALQANAALLHKELRSLAEEESAAVRLVSEPGSYVQHLHWAGTGAEAAERLQAVAEACRRSSDLGMQVCFPFLIGADASFGERIGTTDVSQPSLRLCVSEKHSVGHITAAVAALRKALLDVA